MIIHHFHYNVIEFIRCAGIGNLATFGLQIDVLLRQIDSEIIFFAEDDMFILKAYFNQQ
jgi:hypothetical protein